MNAITRRFGRPFVRLTLLALPQAAAAVWPWSIPPLVAQLYSCFFIALAAIAMLVAQDRRPVMIRNFTISSLALISLMLLVSLMYLGRFTGGVATWLWFGGLIAGVIAFAVALAGRAFMAWQELAAAA